MTTAAYAGAVVAAFEALAVLASARSEAALVAPAVLLAACVEIALAALAGGAAALALAGREGSLPGLRALTCAVTFTSCALFLLANGALPLVEDRQTLAPWAAGAALVIAGIAVLARSLEFRPLVGPVVSAAALVGGFAFGRALHLTAGWRLALVIVAAAAAAVVSAALRRLDVLDTSAAAWRSAAAGPFAVPAVLAVVAFAVPTPFPAPGRRASGPPDVLLVVADTVRADAVPAPPTTPLPTPALARLAADGARYTAAFSTSCWTVPAHASLFTGLTPLEHGAGWESPYLQDDVETLAETFARAGYRTAGFSANIWISPEFGFDQGFDRFVTVSASDRPLVPWPVRVAPGLFAPLDAALPFDDKGGAALASGALGALGGRDDRPAFVFVNLLEAHMPYAPPERFLRRLRGETFERDALLAIPQVPLQGLAPGSGSSTTDLAGLKLLYGAEVAYDDALVGRIVDGLRAAGRLDRTIVVVAGDHGENLGDHPPLDHQLGLWDSLARVPLLVRYPARVAAGAVTDDPVSLADVRAALLDLAAIDHAGGPGPLLAPPRRDAVVLSYDRPGELLDRIRRDLGIDPSPWNRRLDAIRTGDLKWIAGSDGSRMAFDLAHDPGERNDLAAGGAPPAFEALAARLAAVLAAAPAAGSPRDKTMSDETRRQLRSLGYVH